MLLVKQLNNRKITMELLKNVTLATVLGICASTAQADFNPFAFLLTPKDATVFATKMAALVKDQPECQPFKDQIMSYAHGQMTEAKTHVDINAAYERAKSAGCRK